MAERKRGRPVEKPVPAPIPDSPENVLRALVTVPPRREDEWDHLKRDLRPSQAGVWVLSYISHIGKRKGGAATPPLSGFGMQGRCVPSGPTVLSLSGLRRPRRHARR